MKKDYTVLLIQLDGNLASDVSTRCFGRSQRMRKTRASEHRDYIVSIIYDVHKLNLKIDINFFLSTCYS